MTRWIGAALVLVSLASRGERIEAAYRADSVLTFEETSSMAMESDEVSASVNDVQLPPESLEQMGLAMPSMQQKTSLRQTDVVLAAKEGRPTRVRRTFEHLREHSVKKGEEKDKTGPLEGRTLVLTAEKAKDKDKDKAEVVAELEGEGEAIDDKYLAGHRLEQDCDVLLPEGDVAIGDHWQVEDAGLREFLGVGSERTLFAPDDGEDKGGRMFDKLSDGATLTAQVAFAAIEEREGVRCAVLDFTIELDSKMDDPSVFGIEEKEGMEDVSGGLEVELQAKGKLWFALAERRPVAMEQTMEGTMAIHFAARVKAENNDLQMKMHIKFALEGESTSAWSLPK